MRLVIPAVDAQGLYLAARYGPERIGKRGKAAVKFLSSLGLANFEKSKEEFYSALLSSLFDKLGFSKVLVLASSKMGCVNPVAIAEAAKKAGIDLSKTSAENLFRLLVQLGAISKFKTWAVYTPRLEDAILATVAAKGEVKVKELERKLGSGVREAAVKLWAQGLVNIEGNPRGPLRGPLSLPRELVLEYGLVYPESVAKLKGLEGNPRLEKFIERETGQVKYSVAVRGDDRVKIVVQ
ncbi:MAG: hypothetical protein QW291_00780 [Thermofilaceae archaeon]